MNEIIQYPDPRLRQRCEEVSDFASPAPKALSALWSQMYSTMKAAGGAGIAGPQIGVMRRVIVIAREDETFPADSVMMINPVITQLATARRITMEEGCLSMPGVRGPVTRPDSISVAFRDEWGRSYHITCGGGLARVIQHEVDHLDGILFVDRMSKRNQKALGWDAGVEAREITARAP